jgi:hypothetical protein
MTAPDITQHGYGVNKEALKEVLSCLFAHGASYWNLLKDLESCTRSPFRMNVSIAMPSDTSQLSAAILEDAENQVFCFTTSHEGNLACYVSKRLPSALTTLLRKLPESLLGVTDESESVFRYARDFVLTFG